MAEQAPNKCPHCGSPLKKIPAGVSKNGKKYDTFWACQNRNCKYTWNKGDDHQPKQRSTNKGQNNQEIIKGLRSIWKEVNKMRKMMQAEYNISKANKEAQVVSEDEDEEDGIPVIEDDLKTPFD